MAARIAVFPMAGSYCTAFDDGSIWQMQNGTGVWSQVVKPWTPGVGGADSAPSLDLKPITQPPKS